ncbi:hypothetical protein TELCIR_20597 [Teladorsagia circumcincta]|uniref:Uncharacterized protein n=1 Tax=Teladorsagia circumcincta TaxID=45464 RepID=A0A2G9TJ23_TELCI|nr:hypothetical protein TELCIR_20597 [Teladorsagia circumcincta]
MTGCLFSYAPWTCIVLSFICTGLLSLKIPLTEMENNISDFTPYEARSRSELKTYREFFSNRGGPKAIYAFIYAKDGGNLLKTSHLNETVQSGMLISDQYTNESRHLDLGYPITTVLGTKLFMDPNLFGVKVAVKGDQGQELVVSTANRKYKDSLQNPLNSPHFFGDPGKSFIPEEAWR